MALVEWPDRADFLPEPRLEVCIERGEEDDDRRLSLMYYAMDDRQAALESALAPWRED